MKDYLAVLRELAERERHELAEREAKRLAEVAHAREAIDAWQCVYKACQEGDSNPALVPDLAPFIVLARLLRTRGYDHWLPEMAEKFAARLGDRSSFRPGQLFFVQLLIIAGKPGATLEELAAAYQSYSPINAPTFWRLGAAEDVRELLAARIENLGKEIAAKAEVAAAERVERLRLVAGKRPAIEKQIFAVHWSDNDIGPAAIRDRWNNSHPRDFISDGEAGRDDIKKAIARGREFLAENETTAAEMSRILGFALG